MSEDLIAAVDLGSNSFHLVVGRMAGEAFTCIDRMRESVRLAAGLTPEGDLNEPSQKTALEALGRFAERLRGVPSHNIRIVGTNTLRQARNRDAFMTRAQEVLGHAIELVSGVEEARLIYTGVAAGGAVGGARPLVVDIGGGSTEVIVGNGATPLHLESLFMGCVSYSNAYFPDGILGEQNFFDAKTAAALEVIPVRSYYRRVGWDTVIGTSGTAKAIGRILAEKGWSDGKITREGMAKLQTEMIAAGHVSKLQLPNIKQDRLEVLGGGLAIMVAVFDVLKLEEMSISDSALREGIVFDLIGRIHHHDTRDASIAALVQRFGVDATQGKRVAETLSRLLRQISSQERQSAQHLEPFVQWAAHVHELGLAVAHQQHHKHGAYLLENADLAGFSSSEQKLLALFVRLHRRKVNLDLLEGFDAKDREALLRLIVLLRLAVLLNRGRSDEAEPDVSLELSKRRLALRFTPGWEKERPLLRADLKEEQKRLASAKFELIFE